MSLDHRRIKEKFARAKDYISVIEKILDDSLEKFLVNFEDQIKAERSFEVITQIMLDVCTHIISRSNISPPESYSDCMLKLGLLKVLDNKKSKKFSSIVKMRNIITHQYDSIDYSLLYESLHTLITDFKDYQETIMSFLEREES